MYPWGRQTALIALVLWLTAPTSAVFGQGVDSGLARHLEQAGRARVLVALVVPHEP